MDGNFNVVAAIFNGVPVKQFSSNYFPSFSWPGYQMRI
jgi:hypothetical protein